MWQVYQISTVHSQFPVLETAVAEGYSGVKHFASHCF